MIKVTIETDVLENNTKETRVLTLEINNSLENVTIQEVGRVLDFVQEHIYTSDVELVAPGK